MRRKILKVNKPIFRLVILLLTMIVLSFILGKVLTGIMPVKTETEMTRFRKEAGLTLDKLITSESCLAAKEGGKTIELNALEDFQSRYSDIEPECARNYDYGYNIEVDMSGINIWQFGSMSHSEYDALKSSVVLSTSVMIKNGDVIQPGKMTIKMYKGELEELVGMIDRVCDTGLEIVKNIQLSYPVEFNNKYVCMRTGEEFCKKIVCDYVIFKGVDYPGNYSFQTRREFGENVITVDATKTDGI